MEEEGSTLKLIMEKGPREGETLEFRPGSVIRIGRVVRGNTFAIKDDGISSKHFSIESKSGKWVITDLDSSNGTILNGSLLRPLSPSDLGDGDTIKVGEYTSIKVNIEIHGGDTRLRRNPRRRAAREGESDGVGVVAENRSRRGVLKANLASVGKDSVLGLGVDGELGTAAEVVAENQSRRGRPKRAKVAKSQPQESFCEVEKVEKLDNVGPIDLKQGRQVSTRRTRSSKNPENFSLDGNGCQELETSAQIVDKITRGGMRRKKNLRDEPLESIENEVLEEKEDMKVSSLGQEECKEVKENLLNEQSEAVQADVLEDKEVVDESNLGRQGGDGLATALGDKEIGVEAGDGPDLGKMTLEEWFDYLEVYLPKQIHDETEEMILKMNQRAEQFHEFILKQKNDKEKGNLRMG